MRHLNTLSSLGAVVAATVVMVPGLTEAAVMNQSLTFATSGLGVLNSQSFNLFNTNIGTLTQVTLSFNGAASWNGSIKNNSAVIANGTFSVQTDFVLMGGTVASFTALPGNSTYPGAAYTPGNASLDAILRRTVFNAKGYGSKDGSAAVNTNTFPILTAAGSVTNLAPGATQVLNTSDTIASAYGGSLDVSLTAGADLSVFSKAGGGTDAITLNTLSFFTQTIGGGASLQQFLDSDASSGFDITYTYTENSPPPPPGVPEPASMALLGMGLVGVGAAVRRRRRT